MFLALGLEICKKIEIKGENVKKEHSWNIYNSNNYNFSTNRRPQNNTESIYLETKYLSPWSRGNMLASRSKVREFKFG